MHYLSRIERALARIEAAAENLGHAPEDGEEIQRLRAAHEALRGKVQSAIGQIDMLLDSGQER